MPSDLAPISTTTCLSVSFSTVPLMTRSSLTASSASVVKVSSAEAKSSAPAEAAGFFFGCGCGNDGILFSSGRGHGWFLIPGLREFELAPFPAFQILRAPDLRWKPLSVQLIAETELAESGVAGGACRRTRSCPLRYLALLRMRGGCGCFTDCRIESKVVVGSTWRVNLNNPSCRTTKQPASKGNSSSITTASEQCQTRTQVFTRIQSWLCRS